MIIRMLERQWLHFVALAVLVGTVGAIARHEAFRTGASGVLEAIDRDSPRHVVGTVTPWEQRPWT
jgi:hypothetical protein